MDSSAEDTGPSFLPSWKLAKDRWEQHWESQALLETSEGSVSADAFGGALVPPWLHPLQAHSPMGPSSSLAPPSPGSLTNGPQFLPGSTLSWATHQWAPVLPWLHPLRDHSPMGKQAGRDACAVMCKKAPVPPTTPDTKEKRKGQGSRGQERVEINSHYLHQKD